MTLYGSREMHSSIQKAVELLGLGSDALRHLPVNPDFQIDIAVLKTTIAADRAAGYQPLCVIGNAGTVNTGAVDNLDALADLCRHEALWFHVDGTFGALAALSPALRPSLTGMERGADSLAFDLHKWMYKPYEVGCIVVRHAEEHRRAFSLTPDYLMHAEHGLAGLIRATPELQLLAPVPLNIVCFRFAAGHLDGAVLNQLNQELLMRLHESGIAAPSYTMIGGRYALRVAITNHRSRREDFDILVREVLRLGQRLAHPG